jgi:predicted phosphodiesterase
MAKFLTDGEKAIARKVYAETGSQTRAADAAGRARLTIRDYLKGAGLLKLQVAPASAPSSLTTQAEQPVSDYNEGVADYIEWCKANGKPIPKLPGYEHLLPQASTSERLPEVPALIVRASKLYRRVVVLSDIHLPYENKIHLRLALDFITDYRPDLLLLNGDILDAYDISDHQKDPSRAGTLQDEFDSSRWFFRAIDQLGCDVVYVQGNHEQRLERMIANNRGLFKLRSLEWAKAAELPTRWKVYRDQTHYHNGQFAWLHGNLKGRVSSGGVNPAKTIYSKLRISTGCGHFHKESLHIERQYDGSQHISYSQGHLSDVEKAGGYIAWPSWQDGFSIVEFSSDGAPWPYLLRFNNGRLVFGKEYAL